MSICKFKEHFRKKHVKEKCEDYKSLRITCHIGTGEKSANKPADITQVYPHFSCWIKPANITQVTGRYVDLPDVGRSPYCPVTCVMFAGLIQQEKCGYTWVMSAGLMALFSPVPIWQVARSVYPTKPWLIQLTWVQVDFGS